MQTAFFVYPGVDMEIQKQKVIKGGAVAFLVFKILFALFFVAVIALAGVTTALSMRCQVSKTPVDFLGRKVLLAYTDMGMGTAVQKYSLLVLNDPKLEELIIDEQNPVSNSIVVYYSKDYRPNGLVAQRILSQELGLEGELELRFVIKGDANEEENPTPIKFEEILGVVDHQIGITRLAMLGVTNIWFLIFALLLPALLLIVAQLTGLSEPLSIKSAFGKKRDFEEEFQAAASEEEELSPEVIARVKELLLREQDAAPENGQLATDGKTAEEHFVFEADNQEPQNENAENEVDSRKAPNAEKHSAGERESAECGEAEVYALSEGSGVQQNGAKPSGNHSSKKTAGKSYPYAKHKYATGKHKKHNGKRR